MKERKMAEGGVSLPDSPDLKIQSSEISELMKKPLQKGEKRYLLDSRWFKQWKKYAGFGSDANNIGDPTYHPGSIDNTPLLKEGTSELKEHLVEELDHVFLPPEAWDKLVSWYGIVPDQEPVIRSVVEIGLYVKLCNVEVYLVELRLTQNNDDNYVVRKFSKIDTIEHIESEMRKIFNIPEEKETRLWNRYTSYTLEQIVRKDCTVQDTGLYHGQLLMIEQKNDDGTWPRQVKSTNAALGFGSSSSSESKHFGDVHIMGSSRYYPVANYHGGYNSSSYDSNVDDNQPGLCGFNNLGNTCFMNAALQCMSNTPPLTRYFLDDRYWDELNTSNPLGMKGEIAKSYAELIKIAWSGKYNCTAPRNFKTQVGRFAPQFSGYQQQDSQELMAFLLDGLHEDLNRIKRKPYIELRDADGRPDEVVAKEAWDNYRKRNNSIIVDIFHGLLKSTLVCPECSKISVTFDPFCYLTLPLPIKKERRIDVCFVPLNPMATPVQYKPTVPKAGSIRDLCEALTKFTGASADKLIVADVFNNKFQKIYQFDEGLNNITDRDSIYVYEVPVTSFDDPDLVLVPVYMRQRLWSGCVNDTRRSTYLFGVPFFVTVPRKHCTCDVLYQTILRQMQRYVEVPSVDYQWWIKQDEGIVNGEVEMSNGDDEDDIESQAVDDAVQSKEDDEGIDCQEECDSGGRCSDDGSNSHHLFTMHFVNSSGNSELEKVTNDDGPLKFLHRSYLAIDWHPLAKEAFYNGKVAEDVKRHDSAMSNSCCLQKRQVIQLSECLELFTATERLSAEDSWFCPSCKKHQQATKKFDLWSLPQVLVLCFKRFSYNRFIRDKIDTLVEFPTRGLNMSKYIINPSHGPATYDLIGVANHYGGLGGGHYTAYARNKDDLKWYHFDDNSVASAQEESVVSKAAYVLFYMLCDPRASVPSPATRRDIPAAVGTPNVNGDDGGSSSNSDEDVATDRMDIN